MKGAMTEEDLTITDPQERTRLYGQADHVRQYGYDFKERLQEAGFETMEISLHDLIRDLSHAGLVFCLDFPLLRTRCHGNEFGENWILPLF